MKWVTFLLALWLGLCTQPHAKAVSASAELPPQEMELEQLRERIGKLQRSLRELDLQKGSLFGQLAEIEREYGSLISSLRSLKAAALEGTLRLDKLRKRQQELRSLIFKRKQALEGQLRAAYAVGKQDWLKLALNQESATRLSRVLIYYGYLNRARLSELENLHNDLVHARTVTEQLEQVSQQLEKTRSQLEDEQKRLGESKRERKAILAKVESELEDKNGQLRGLQEDENRLRGLILSLQHLTADMPVEAPEGTGPFSQARGRLEWPVKGPVLAQFGTPRMSGQWDGVLIGAPEGTPVRAVSPGRVAFADWLRGYGLLAIVDHGEGYMSLYAFNQSLFKNVGDWVESGEPIASVGASGGQPEPGLYFGVRENGRPVNPLSWCGKAK